MLDRIFLLGLILAVTVIAFKKSMFKRNDAEMYDLLHHYKINPALPTILYFWTEQCMQCKYSQKPALTRLKDSNPDFNLVPVNALDMKEISDFLKIKTVPATAVFNSKHKLRFTNNGFASEDRLLEQISEAEEKGKVNRE